MRYLVFDCRKASGYLFETRHKWVAKLACYVLDVVAPCAMWDYEPDYTFGTEEA